MKNVNVNFLCDPSEIERERSGYIQAFQRRLSAGGNNVIVGNELREGLIAIYPDPPISGIPLGLPNRNVLSVCFHFDTFSKPEWRSLWSSLFDYVFLFHPGYEDIFARYGHRKVFVLSHAVHGDEYEHLVEDREFEVGWVGSIAGPYNESRRRILPVLEKSFLMNTWRERYPEELVGDVYRRSKIVVNISRDDHPEDANMRCFEAMAAGALLITKVPSELEFYGFRHEVDYIGYESEAELPNIVGSYLEDEVVRKSIIESARSRVLKNHTYDANVEKILNEIGAIDSERTAPAHRLPAGKLKYIYVHYYCKRRMMKEALTAFKDLLSSSPFLAALAIPLLLRGVWHTLSGTFRGGRLS